MQDFLRKNGRLLAVALMLIVVLTTAYLNHFNNGFFFDDSHTIVNNTEIRDLSNIGRFFTDGTTFSTLPANQSYRPVVTAMNALDYWMAGELDSFYFHVHIYLVYLLQLILMFFMFRHLIRQVIDSEWEPWYALALTALYGFHLTNAETLNYIISRSDATSTLMVIIAVLIYMKTNGYRRLWALLPITYGMLTKPTALMFVGIAFTYSMLFEGGIVIKRENGRLKLNAPGMIAFGILTLCTFLLFQFTEFMTPQSWVPGGTNRWRYLITQPYVIFSYFTAFFIPHGLSPDTDWKLINSITHQNFMIGFLFMMASGYIVFIAASKKKWYPIAFGMAWFFFALVPTSSVIPFSEVKNDHRIFFPYVGMPLVALWVPILWAEANKDRIRAQNTLRWGFIGLFCLILILHAFGIRERNKIWSSSESLWGEVVKKSPGNPRGLMNYGVALMGKGEYDQAETYFRKALAEWPYYAYLHINMGILMEAQMNRAEADKYFQNAMKYGATNPEAYYYYARYQINQKDYEGALTTIRKGLTVSPNHVYLQQQLTVVEKLAQSGSGLEQVPAQNLNYDQYIELSLHQYNSGDYNASLRSAQAAIKLDSTKIAGWNNACASYNMLKKWDEAIDACRRALEINPNFDLARNNLNWALSESEKK